MSRALFPAASFLELLELLNDNVVFASIILDLDHWKLGNGFSWIELFVSWSPDLQEWKAMMVQATVVLWTDQDGHGIVAHYPCTYLYGSTYSVAPNTHGKGLDRPPVFQQH